MMRIDANSWYFSPDHGQLCQVIKTQMLCGETTCRVWLPGRSIYDELAQGHRSRLTHEREKGEYAFTARRKIIERIGLPQVRDYRLNLLWQEERSWNEKLERKAQVYPEMIPLLVIRTEVGAHE